MKTFFTSTLSLAFVVFLSCGLMAQNDDDARMKAISEGFAADSLDGWTTGGGLGLDLGNILVLNPRPGSGQNRIGIGGAVGIFAYYKKDRFKWDNTASLNLSVQKQGSGVLPFGDNIKVPFEKSIDDLRLGSTASYDIREGSKWAYAADFGLRTQLTPSYQGDDGQLYMKEIIEPGDLVTTLVSKIFAPARIDLGVGIQYEHSEHLSLYFSPVTLDLIVISDEDIANLGIHGTELEDENVPGIYKQTRLGLGAALKGVYHNTYLNDKLAFKSELALFSNYLSEPQNVDLDWTNELAYELLKGLHLTYQNNISYDDNVLSNVSDFDEVGGIKLDANGMPIARPTINYYHQILLKYVQVF